MMSLLGYGSTQNDNSTCVTVSSSAAVTPETSTSIAKKYPRRVSYTDSVVAPPREPVLSSQPTRPLSNAIGRSSSTDKPWTLLYCRTELSASSNVVVPTLNTVTT